LTRSPIVRGLITERDFNEAESEFPGITKVYGGLSVKPATFLELLHVYLVDPRREHEPVGRPATR
jgi:hypothetical protein